MRVLYLSYLAAISRETTGFKFCLNQYTYVCFICASSGGSGGTYNCTLSQKTLVAGQCNKYSAKIKFPRPVIHA